MRWESALAIYALFWVFCVFLVLPFGVRTADEAGVPRVDGQADSAPATFSLARLALRTTIVSLVTFGLWYANYVFGWITVDMLDYTRW